MTGMSLRPRLLIADDDPVIHAALAGQLAAEFDIVARAFDATETVALAAEHQPEIAIVDVQMPAGGGLRAIRDMQTCAPHTAIVALSADESDSGVRELISAGAITYLRKGITGPQLAETLRQSLEAHSKLASAGRDD